MATTAEVVSYLNSHDVGDCDTVLEVTERSIVVSSAYTLADGTTHESLDVIEPTMAAAREWLGY